MDENTLKPKGKNKISTVAIVDDHKLVSKAIAELVQGFKNYSILFQLNNGKELLDKLKISNKIPEIILLDVNMPVMNGFETMKSIRAKYPEIKVLVLSMNDDEETIIRMIKLGACGYVSKLADEDELILALDTIVNKGYYYNEAVTNYLAKSINTETKVTKPEKITNRERELLHLICTEMTYKEIADKMFLSPKTVDGYRDTLFQKLNIKTRVGLVIYAIKNKYYKVG
jgi:DNA-binding NarL/FixJ family response regulator